MGIWPSVVQVLGGCLNSMILEWQAPCGYSWVGQWYSEGSTSLPSVGCASEEPGVAIGSGERQVEKWLVGGGLGDRKSLRAARLA